MKTIQTTCRLTVCLFLTLLLAACRQEPLSEALSFQNVIRLDKPAVGQVSRYVRFWGEDVSDPLNFKFRYLTDTLEIRIAGRDSLGWIVQEQLTPYSESLHDSPDKLAWADSVFQNRFRVDADSFYLLANGNLFPYYTIPRSHFFRPPVHLPIATVLENPTRIQGWKTLEPYCECFRKAYADEYMHFGYPLPHLNVVIDNRNMATDGPGHLHIFHPKFGFIKVASYSWWTRAGEGWDLLP